MASNPNNSSIVEYCPLRSRYFMCRRCGNNIASANLLQVITYTLTTKITLDRFPLIIWDFRRVHFYGHFDNLENVNLDQFTAISVDRTSDSDVTMGVKKIYCRNCNAVLGEKMVNRPKYYSIEMEKLLYWVGNNVMSPASLLACYVSVNFHLANQSPQ